MRGGWQAVARRYVAGCGSVDSDGKPRQKRTDRVAGGAGADRASDGFDDACGFMAENDRYLGGIGAFDEVKVRVTDTCGRSSDQHLIGAGLADLDVFNAQRFSDFTQDCGFHGVFPFGLCLWSFVIIPLSVMAHNSGDPAAARQPL